MKPIWSIGYENFGQADFIATLREARIETLIDVRDLANSRRAGFAKCALTAGLGEFGIAYVHLKQLGTPKAGRQQTGAVTWTRSGRLSMRLCRGQKRNWRCAKPQTLLVRHAPA
jgi:uncharacterized protein (DUF488 family)